jgi:dipeptidyl aminopeptidase/acylaminoacyl peptidase
MRTQWASAALSCVESFEGGPPDTKTRRARYSKTSPVNYIDHTDPPTFVANALWDRHVPMSEMMHLDERLTAAHVPHQMATAPNGHHATELEYDKAAGKNATVMTLAIKFLRAHI